MTYMSALDALADPTRRAIFERLHRQAASVGDLTAAFPVSQPAVSQHLGVLRRAGLVRCRKEGRLRIYRADVAGLDHLRRYIDTLWRDALRAYGDSFVQSETGE